jgi:lysylphosphatidylglycerol synthetase-like protein (DUF2156 family)
MVSSQRPETGRLEPIARWLATLAAAVFCALSLLATPFGCAVGEFEEDRNCDPSALSWASVVVLVVTIVAARVTRRRDVHWIGLAVTFVLAIDGALQA